jgi:hypothetical protein
VERAPVISKRELVLGAAVDVVEDEPRQPPPGQPPQIADVDGRR